MTNEMTAKEAIRWLDMIKKYYIHGGDEAYDKKRMKAIDKAIQALEQQPSEDCISREAVIRLVEQYPNIIGNRCSGLIADIKHLPSVKPKYTDEEIDKAQAVEQAYVDKMVELAVEETRREWLNSFDTSSATKCFEAVNILKERLEGEE